MTNSASLKDMRKFRLEGPIKFCPHSSAPPTWAANATHDDVRDVRLGGYVYKLGFALRLISVGEQRVLLAELIVITGRSTVKETECKRWYRQKTVRLASRPRIYI